MLAVAACGRTEEAVAPKRTASAERPVNEEPSGVATRFVGTEWRLILLHDREPLGGTSITLEVDRDAGRVEVGGTAGCNFYGLGHPTMSGGVLESRGVESTEIGCPGDRGRQEIAYLGALGKAATYRLRGDTLEVQNPGGETTLVYEREPLPRSDPAELVGTRWLLRSVDGRLRPDAFPTTVSFGPEHKISGYDGCRHFTGRYYSNENDLTVPNYGYEVEEDCLKPGAYGDTGVPPVVDNVPLEGNYALREGRLEVRYDSGAVSVYGPLREGVVVEEPGSAWVLEKFVERDRATSVLDGTRITLRFDRGTLRRTGMMSGSAGCNTYSADYEYINEFTSGTPTVTSITEKVCPAPAGAMEQERRYLSRLEVDTYWYALDIKGNLKLSTRDGERKMKFVAPE